MSEAEASPEAEATAEDEGPRTAKRVSGIEKNAKLEVLVTENPKREDSQAYDRFKGYFTLEGEPTVDDALTAGLTMGDIKYDTIHGFISVDGATVEEYEITPRGSRGNDEESEEETLEDDDSDGEDGGF